MASSTTIVKADKKGIEIAVKFLRAGKAVVYPTDTAYGLGVDATNLKAVQRLYRIKERRQRQPIHVVVNNLSAVKKLSTLNPVAKNLMKEYWPGPLTVVLDLRLKSKSFSLLSGGTGTIGLRMPDDKVVQALVEKLGRPITTPSANPADGATPYSIQDSFRQFRGKKYRPDLYLDAGKLRKVQPSTIVSVEYDKIKVIRRGPVKL